MSTDLIQYKVDDTITGVVQGVNFRSHTQKEAEKLQLQGWCQNHPDESVEGVAVGTSDKIKQFHAYLQSGPDAADVEKVHIVKEISGASEDEIQKALGDHKGGYEVRKYKGGSTK